VFALEEVLIMKKITAFLMLACLLVSVSTLAQQITFSKKNVTLEELSKEIEKTTGFTLVYNSRFSSQIKPVTISVTNVTLQQLLDEYFKNQPYTYKFINKLITLIPREDLPPSERLVSIKGKIVNEQNEPIPGATIAIKGSNQQTSTNENGEFTLFGVNELNLNIEITSINYETQEINWQGEPELDIRLKQHISELSKVSVVSTGYQKIIRDKTPGSFTKIDNELLNRRVSTNIIDRLEGITSGLIFNRNINPSVNQSSISIRGRSTIFANANPLIVVDNFPYTGDINNINPNDVENITVLKDADAASIWGAYSGNGVIVITTKKGKYNQPLKLSFNSNVTVSAKPDQYYLPSMSSPDFIEVEQLLFDSGYYRGAELNPSHPVLSPAVEIMIKKRDGDISASEAAAQLDVLKSQDRRKDLDKYFYRHGVNQQYALNASGGSYNNNYYFSVGYDKNLSTAVRNDFNRLTLTANNSFAWLKKKLELNTGIIFTSSTARNNNPGVITN
jgi:TonB-dependent SusC/RagA subfamily outer membrane receptor